jgi:hypothetical protein
MMKDEEFSKRLKSREVSFAKGDILRMRLRSRSYVTGEGLRTETEIVKVLEIIDQPKSRALLDHPDVEPDLPLTKGPKRRIKL